MLADQPSPKVDWRLSSLVTTLRASLLQDQEGAMPTNHTLRDEAVREIVNELTRRGLDGDSLLRYGLGPELVWAVLSLLLPRRFPASAVVWDLDPTGSIEDKILSGDHCQYADVWEIILGAKKLTDEDSNELPTGDEIVQFVASISMNLIPWILSAPLGDLIALRPPSPGQLVEYGAITWIPEISVMEEYRWAVERFATTHLNDWSTSSLHLEYRWHHGRHPAPCAPDLMSDRPISIAALQAEISQRATSKSTNEIKFGPVGMETALSTKMHSRALELLHQGRHRDAATLYKFALSQNPEDAHAANNLGFCLIPDDPGSALRHLSIAGNLGYSFPEINLYNRSICHFLLGDYHAALSLLAQEWDNVTVGTRAIVWSPSSPGIKLCETDDLRRKIAQLARISASKLGNTAEEAKWISRSGN